MQSCGGKIARTIHISPITPEETNPQMVDYLASIQRSSRYNQTMCQKKFFPTQDDMLYIKWPLFAGAIFERQKDRSSALLLAVKNRRWDITARSSLQNRPFLGHLDDS